MRRGDRRDTSLTLFTPVLRAAGPLREVEETWEWERRALRFCCLIAVPGLNGRPFLRYHRGMAKRNSTRRSTKRSSRPSPKNAPGKRRGPPAKQAGAKQAGAEPQAERLQKVLAAAGLGSRRACEELITTGRVEIDRQVVTELGTRVDPRRQEVRVDGEPLAQPKLVCYAVNKPTGVVSTNRDPQRRPRVIDLLPSEDGRRLFPVGRLDLNSEGLILVTNDGDLANQLTHPRYGVAKTYRVQVAGRPGREVLAQLRRGVRLAEGIAKAESVKVRSHHKQSTVLEMVLREGRNREIRRMLAAVEHKVMRLVRVAVGPVRLGELAPGKFRRLDRKELAALRKAATMPSARSENRHV